MDDILSLSLNEIIKNTSNVFLKIIEDLLNLPEKGIGNHVLTTFIKENRMIYIGILIIFISIIYEIILFSKWKN